MRIGTPEFTTWMRAKPRPDRVKAYLDSGSPRTVKVRPRKGVRYWKEVTDALSAYEVMRVELLDEAGNVLRTMTVEADEEPEDPNAERVQRQANGARNDALVEPSDVVAGDGRGRRETRLVEFARLLKEAYTTGASLQADASKHAFDKLVALTETAFQRLDQLERAYNRVFRQRIKNDLAEGEDLEDETSKAIKGMVAQRFLGAGPGVATNGDAGPVGDFKAQLREMVSEVIVEMNRDGGGE